MTLNESKKTLGVERKVTLTNRSRYQWENGPQVIKKFYGAFTITDRHETEDVFVSVIPKYPVNLLTEGFLPVLREKM